MSDFTPIALGKLEEQLLSALRTRDGRFDTRLADMYLGALYALSRADNPERFSQAAQSMRELLEKLAIQFDGAPAGVSLEWASDQIKSIESELLKAREKSRCFDGTPKRWSGEIDQIVRRLLIRVERAVDRRRAAPTWRDHQRRFLGATDTHGGELTEEQETAILEEWKRFNKFFQGTAHHKFEPTPLAFERMMYECNEFVLARIRVTTFTRITQLDEIVTDAERDA